MVSKGSTTYPESSSPAVTARMTGNRSTGTRPEAAVRSLLHRNGYRFRKNRRLDVGGHRCRPDVLFPRERVAVFVDGCFWHACPDHGRVPGGKNAAYWQTKFKRNAERDYLDTSVLEDAGWTVLRFWEHDSLEKAADLIAQAVVERRNALTDRPTRPSVDTDPASRR